MIDEVFSIISIVVSVCSLAGLLATPSLFYDNCKRFDNEYFINASFNIRHEANVMMGLAWVTIALLVIGNFLGFCDLDFVLGIALFFTWFTMTIQCAYVDKSKSALNYLHDSKLEPHSTNMEEYFGKYYFNKCYNANYSSVIVMECIETESEAGFLKFYKSAKACMIYMIVCALLSLVYLASDEFGLSLGIFFIMTVVSLAFSLPVYAAGIMNRQPYKDIFKVYSEVKLKPLIGLGFASWIVLVLAIVIASFECEAIGFFGIIAAVILEIMVVIYGTSVSEKMKEINIPIIQEAEKIIYGLTIPHIIVLSVLGIVFVVACCCGEDSSPSTGTSGGDFVVAYAQRVTYIIETPTQIIIGESTSIQVYG